MEPVGRVWGVRGQRIGGGLGSDPDEQPQPTTPTLEGEDLITCNLSQFSTRRFRSLDMFYRV